jgi:hypothetical protein
VPAALGYSFAMPKILVLFATDAALAESVAAGARAVRFAEVDVRSDAAGLADYDAIVVDAAAPDRAAMLTGAGPFGHTVGAVFGGDDAARWAALRTLADAGMLLVPPSTDAAALGKRVATVAEWVRHARSHHHH